MRETIISDALNTKEVRAALASAMTAPINTSLNYQNIGRKLLQVEELPEVYPGVKGVVKEYIEQWMQK